MHPFLVLSLTQKKVSIAKCDVNRNESPLSFTVIVPNKFDEDIHGNISNDFFVHKLLLDNRSHYYTVGAQQKQRHDASYSKRKLLLKSTCDTCIYVFQNEIARKRWPVHGDFDKMIRKAFKS
mmetsp:Transcript_11480/g.14291  ORF Transcript_11480/g.14291 Transcript_11480/m.14291 type:complete len:122 (-) Transcript_11480:1292-1657(-)